LEVLIMKRLASLLGLPIALLFTTACNSSLDAAASADVDGGANAEGGVSGDGGYTAANAPPGLSPSDAMAICTTIRNASCDLEQRCSPLSIQIEYGTVDKCKMLSTPICAAALQLPGVHITQAQATACANAYAASDCTKSFEEFNLTDCKMPGLIADGQACLGDDQCVSGNCESGSPCGTCKPLLLGGPIGGACTQASDCILFADCVNGKCVEAGKKQGESCAQNDDCNNLQNLSCVLSQCSLMTSAITTPTGCGDGAMPNTAIECVDGICDPNTSKCYTHAMPGGACDPTVATGLICYEEYYCDPTSKTCVIPSFSFPSMCAK
jgi:hypothetical protein